MVVGKGCIEGGGGVGEARRMGNESARSFKYSCIPFFILSSSLLRVILS